MSASECFNELVIKTYQNKEISYFFPFVNFRNVHKSRDIVGLVSFAMVAFIAVELFSVVGEMRVFMAKMFQLTHSNSWDGNQYGNQKKIERLTFLCCCAEYVLCSEDNYCLYVNLRTYKII